MIDYGMINMTALERMCSFRVEERTESDHQLISLTLGIQTQVEMEENKPRGLLEREVMIWKEET